jgi:NAD(P)-dependent dehydrogenase (short-subunit alcohol dehydrogenase family)
MAPGKLLVMGASSPTGQLIVKRALEEDWQVTTYGRRTTPDHEANADIKVRAEMKSTQRLCHLIAVILFPLQLRRKFKIS